MREAESTAGQASNVKVQREPSQGITHPMTNDETQNEEAGRAPSEPEQDPKVHPSPPGNPDIDQERLDKAKEGLDEVVGR